jgi:hypothetical protein
MTLPQRNANILYCKFINVVLVSYKIISNKSFNANKIELTTYLKLTNQYLILVLSMV